MINDEKPFDSSPIPNSWTWWVLGGNHWFRTCLFLRNALKTKQTHSNAWKIFIVLDLFMLHALITPIVYNMESLQGGSRHLNFRCVNSAWQRWARWKCSCCAPLGAKWYSWRRVRILLNLGCNMGASAFLDLYWRWVSAARILLFYDHVCQFIIKWKCSVSRLPLHFSRVWIAQPVCRLS